jgi:hypothetical protein
MYTGDWAADVLRNIGMKEGESLKSTMIGRRVKAAQEAIALRAHGDAPADSPEEWLERNGSIS